MPVCEIDLRRGGRWRFVWRRADGSQMEMTGVYREIDPIDRLVCTEAWGGDWAETLNTLELDEEEGLTTAVLTMLYPSPEDRDRALDTGMQDGLNESYERLARYLTSLA